MSRITPVSLLASAGVLILLSLLWPVVVRPRVVWGVEQAERRARAAAELHEYSHEAAHEAQRRGQDPEKAAREAPEVVEARQRYEAANAELQRARFQSSGIASWLWWMGVLLGIGGAGQFLWIHRKKKA